VRISTRSSHQLAKHLYCAKPLDERYALFSTLSAISRGAVLDRAPDCRKYNEFARKMQAVVPTIPIEDNLPQVPCITVEVL
jgi:hypothetical protein